MMKVHSSRLIEALANDRNKSCSQLVSMIRGRRAAQEPLIIDGPFAESKESCSHVIILARRMSTTG
jgi:hypothetical protein